MRPPPNNFDVLKEMSRQNCDIRLAPLDNVIRARTCRAGTQVTIGVGGDVVAALMHGRFVGGLILADKKQFERVKAELAAAAVRPPPNNFDVLKEMSRQNCDIRLAPLDNVIRARTCRAGTQVTIGVGGDVVAALMHGRFVGGLILADKKQFERVKAELAAAAGAVR